jgi:hypothetical protein
MLPLEVAPEFAYAFSTTPVGEEGWMWPIDDDDLRDFQAAVASAEAWEFLGVIKIIEVREEAKTGRRLVEALRFKRLR